MLDSLVHCLRAAGLSVAADDLRDILWLAEVRGALPAGPAPALPAAASAPASQLPEGQAPLPAGPGLAAATVQPAQRDAAALYASAQRGTVAAGVLRVPGVAVAPAPADLRRALQPLARRVPSATRWQLDEEATATHKADTGVWLLCHQAVRERWFDLNLIVERSASMNIWRADVDTLARCLQSQGGFRSVRRFMLDGPGPGLLRTAQGGRVLPLGELQAPGRRPLTLLLTDTGSELWRSGAAQGFLFAVGSLMPLGLLQLLPQRVWRHTALGEPDMAAWYDRAGRPNLQMTAASDDGWAEAPDPDRCPVPMLGTDPASIRRWALATAARVAATVPCASVNRLAAPLPQRDQALTAAERVAAYRRKVSRAAYDLAVFLTVPDPLTVPVMRLVQRSMLPDTGTGELAEFFLGGLIEPLGDEAVAGGTVYRLREGVRGALAPSLRYSEEALIDDQLARVGRTLEAALAAGAGGGFDAYFPSPGGGARLSEWALPFATASLGILRAVAGGVADAAAADVSEAASVAAAEPARVACMAISPDRTTAVTGSPDGTLRLWHTADARATGVVRKVHSSAVVGLAWAADGRSIVSLGRRIRFSDAASLDEAGLPWHAGGDCIALAPDGGLIAVGHQGVVSLRDMASESSHQLLDIGLPVLALRFCHGSRFLATAYADGSVRMWESATMRLIDRQTRHVGSVRCLGGDGRDLLVSAGDDGMLRCWDVKDHGALALRADAQADAPVRSLDCHTNVTCASLGNDHTIQLWKLRTLDRVGGPWKVGPEITAVLFAGEGSLVLCSASGEISRIPNQTAPTAPAARSTTPTDTFLSGPDVQRHVRDSGRMAEGDEPLDRLLLFATHKQQTWVVFTRQALVVLLDDASTRASGRLVQRLVPLDKSQPVDARVDRSGTATVAFGSESGRWYYSKALFATPALLREAVDEQIAAARSAPPVRKDVEAAGRAGGPVFISCAWAPRDRAWADILAAQLQAAGLQLVEHDVAEMAAMRDGRDVSAELHTTIARCQAAVLLISQGWLDSHFCQQEATLLLYRAQTDPSFRVFPLRLDDAPMPALLASKLWLDFRNTAQPEGPLLATLIAQLQRPHDPDLPAPNGADATASALPDPPPPADSANSPGPVFASRVPQVLTIGSLIAEFGPSLPSGTRRAVAESLLLAHLAATRAAGDDAPLIDWFHKYTEVLQTIGWATQDLALQQQDLSADGGSLREAMLPVLTAMLGPAAAASSHLVALLDSLDLHMPEEAAWSALHRASAHERGAKLQLAYIEADDKGNPQVQLLCVNVQAQHRITQVLFFKLAENRARVTKANGLFTIQRGQLEAVQSAIAARVAPFVAEHMRSVAT